MDEIVHFTDNSPRWRWEQIRAMVDADRTPNRGDDELIRKGVYFLRRWNGSEPADLPALKRDYPGLFEAHMLYANPASEQWIIEAGLLTEATIHDIADFVGQTATAIEAYAAYFFDVTAKKKARGYIINQVLVPSVTRGIVGRSHDFILKTLAYAAGWKIFTEFIDDQRMSDTARSFLQNNYDEWLLKLGYVATHRVEVNNFNAVELIDKCIRVREVEAQRGTPLVAGEAWQAVTTLLQQCVTTIIPPGGQPILDEPQFGAEKTLEYKGVASQPAK